MLVALRDSGGGKQGLSAELQPALAAGYAVLRARRLPSTSTTHRANFSGSLHSYNFLLLPMCTAEGIRASDHGGSSVYILWSCEAGCGEPGGIPLAICRESYHSQRSFRYRCELCGKTLRAFNR